MQGRRLPPPTEPQTPLLQSSMQPRTFSVQFSTHSPLEYTSSTPVLPRAQELERLDTPRTALEEMDNNITGNLQYQKLVYYNNLLLVKFSFWKHISLTVTLPSHNCTKINIEQNFIYLHKFWKML